VDVVKVTLPISWGPNNYAVNGIESPDWLGENVTNLIPQRKSKM